MPVDTRRNLVDEKYRIGKRKTRWSKLGIAAASALAGGLLGAGAYHYATQETPLPPYPYAELGSVKNPAWIAAAQEDAARLGLLKPMKPAKPSYLKGSPL